MPDEEPREEDLVLVGEALLEGAEHHEEEVASLDEAHPEEALEEAPSVAAVAEEVLPEAVAVSKLRSMLLLTVGCFPSMVSALGTIPMAKVWLLLLGRRCAMSTAPEYHISGSRRLERKGVLRYC